MLKLGFAGLDVIKDELEELERFIAENIISPQPLVSSAVCGLLSAGGKRVRPALTILVGKAIGCSDGILIPIAASMEIIHMATLVHDDIVDDASTRRGKTTVQSRYGKDVAVFTGDYLFSKAFLIVSQYADKYRLKGFSDAVKRICEGEIEQYENRFSLDISLLKYIRRIRKKTGVLLSLSCMVGAVNKKLKGKLIKSLGSYGMHLGMAFQITDDILDYTGEEKTVGKPVGNDIRQGIYTLPLIYCLKYSKYGNEMAELLNRSEYSEGDIGNIIEMVKLTGGIEFSRKLALRYVKKGLDDIELLKDTPYKKALKEFIMGLNEREY